MSFDVNVLSTKPVIKAAASMQNDGGGGNLGYMAQGEREEKEKQNKNTESIFAKKPEIDTFGYQKNWEINQEESFSFQKFFKELINSIKSLFKKN
ncbi:MAG: hypothetical protein ACLSWI_08365 [Candidatus Gastranaerophilaceae bacterium]